MDMLMLLLVFFASGLAPGALAGNATAATNSTATWIGTTRDIEFYGTPGCYKYIHGPMNWNACRFAPPGYCCDNQHPLCGWAGCDDCNVYDMLYGFPGISCTWSARTDFCQLAIPGGCCVKTNPHQWDWNADRNVKCSAAWLPPCTPNCKDTDQGHNDASSANLTTTEAGSDGAGLADVAAAKVDCLGSIHPNFLHYADDKGNEREIYIPQDKFEQAMDAFKNKDWGALAEFEEYTGADHQGYTDQDLALARKKVQKRAEKEFEA